MQFVPPQLGIASREKHRERRSWHNDVQKSLLGDKPRDTNKPNNREDSSYTRTINTLVENMVKTEETKRPKQTAPASSVFNYAPTREGEGENDKVTRAFSVIQKKYEQNLHVVEKLFTEKESLEQYAQSLEAKLMRITGTSSQSDLRNFLQKDTLYDDENDHDLEGDRRDAFEEDHGLARDENHDDEMSSSASPTAPRPSTFEPSILRASVRKASTESLTAREMAELLNRDSADRERERALEREKARAKHRERMGRSLDSAATHAHRSRSAPRSLAQHSTASVPNEREQRASRSSRRH